MQTLLINIQACTHFNKAQIVDVTACLSDDKEQLTHTDRRSDSKAAPQQISTSKSQARSRPAAWPGVVDYNSRYKNTLQCQEHSPWLPPTKIHIHELNIN